MRPRLHSVGHVGADRTGDNLRASVHFAAESGQIWLHEHRMLLVHAEAQALLRKELIDTLGMNRAQGLFSRMGYAAGARDAELARTRAQSASDKEAFRTGPELHALEGVVKVSSIKLDLDRVTGKFYAESPLGKFLGRSMAQALLWHARRTGMLVADRVRLRLRLELHGPADTL